MTKTTNYQLNQWAKSDRIMMDDFNADNQKIDAALKAVADGGAKLAVGTYTGTGNSTGKNFESVSGPDGIATFDVPDGFYTLSEKTAPEGYIKSEQTYEIAIWDGKVHFYNENPATPDEQYSDYQQVTYVNEAEEPVDPQSPKTGDNSIMGLWLALLIVSGAGVAGCTIYRSKKKYSEK